MNEGNRKELSDLLNRISHSLFDLADDVRSLSQLFDCDEEPDEDESGCESVETGTVEGFEELTW